ncbi:MAG: 1-deoxy-D-xylulose-5-phosphate reductoisomerase [Acidimicrobiales bacterium]|jgi:1-deoxy-D-xylulose-5-phosphate reductoisomerase
MTLTSVAVLGSTGSIGTQTLEIVRARPDQFTVVALAAGRSVDALIAQAREFSPQLVVTADEQAVGVLRDALPGVTVASGTTALAEAAVVADVTINGVVGFAGLPVTLATLAAGKRLGLANKESLIAGGPVVQTVRATPGAELLPVDSEHCALHQCLRSNEFFVDDGLPDRIHELVLTASGGPFRSRTAAELREVTIESALAHPTWSMGPKVTIDSSTLMNKGLEVIEAHELYGVGYDDIRVVVHPQSIIHSMVTFTDGATIAQLSMPDMRLCMGYAMSYPDRLDVPYGAIDWDELRRLDFEAPDNEAFPCLQIAYAAGRLGQTAPARVSAANEVAVESFLVGAIAWHQIPGILSEVLSSYDHTPAHSVDAVVEADARARLDAMTLVKSLAK